MIRGGNADHRTKRGSYDNKEILLFHCIMVIGPSGKCRYAAAKGEEMYSIVFFAIVTGFAVGLSQSSLLLITTAATILLLLFYIFSIDSLSFVQTILAIFMFNLSVVFALALGMIGNMNNGTTSKKSSDRTVGEITSRPF